MTILVRFPILTYFLWFAVPLFTACVGEALPAPEGSSTEPADTTGEPMTPTTSGSVELPDSSATGEPGTTTSTGEPDPDASSSTDTPGPLCGDGVVDEAESCDEGFAANTFEGACLPDCTDARCGDGFVHAGSEDCDLGDTGNSFDYGGCNPVTCKWGPRCGDGEVDAPNEVCDPGDPNGQGDGVVACDGDCRFVGRIVFVSSVTFDGDLGGLGGADKQCRLLAAKFDAVHADTYRAWLSDAVDSPSTRFAHGPEFDAIPYVMRNGVQIASDFTALTLEGPWPGIHVTEEGEVLMSKAVWTNTGVDGHRLSVGDHCDGWTSNVADEAAPVGVNWLPAMSPGLPHWQQFGHWTSANDSGCYKKWHLYCFEN
jgi:hypothetical protein